MVWLWNSTRNRNHWRNFIILSLYGVKSIIWILNLEPENYQYHRFMINLNSYNVHIIIMLKSLYAIGFDHAHELCRNQPQGLVCDFQNGTLLTPLLTWPWATLFQSMTVVRIINLVQIPNTLWKVKKRNPLHFPHIYPLLVNILACLDVSKLVKSGGVASYQNE